MTPLAPSPLQALCQMRRAQGGCPLDAQSAAKHVAETGLELKVTILSQRPPAKRDELTGEQLLAACEDIKERANALLTSGYVAGAMRKYVFATWLMQVITPPSCSHVIMARWSRTRLRWPSAPQIALGPY